MWRTPTGSANYCRGDLLCLMFLCLKVLTDLWLDSTGRKCTYLPGPAGLCQRCCRSVISIRFVTPRALLSPFPLVVHPNFCEPYRMGDLCLVWFASSSLMYRVFLPHGRTGLSHVCQTIRILRTTPRAQLENRDPAVELQRYILTSSPL